MSKQRFLGGLLGASPVRANTTATAVSDFTTLAEGTQQDFPPGLPPFVTGQAFWWAPDGTSITVGDYTLSGDPVYNYPLPTPWDTSSYVSNTATQVSTGMSYGQVNLWMSHDGLKMWAPNGSSPDYWTMTAAYDLSTATHSSLSLSVTMTSIHFNDDGTRVYWSDTNNLGTLYQADLSTAYDITDSSRGTASTLDFSAQAPSIFLSGLAWYDGGSKLVIIGFNHETMHLYDCATAYDITTATHNSSYTFSSSDTRSIQYANNRLWTYKHDGTPGWLPTSELTQTTTSTDRTTANVGILSLDEAGPEDTATPASVTYSGTFAATDTDFTLVAAPYHTQAINTGSWKNRSFSETLTGTNKYYCEIHVPVSASNIMIGVGNSSLPSTSYAGQSGDNGISFYSSNGNYYYSGVGNAYGSAWNSGAKTIGMAIDMDARTIWWSIDGVWQNSSDPSAGTGGIAMSGNIATGDVFINVADNSTTTADFHLNTGENGTFNGVLTAGGNTDTNGLGDFKYAVPTGFSVAAAVTPGETRDLTQINWGGLRGRSSVIETTNPSLDLSFDGQASSFTRATTDPTAAKANGDQLATDIVAQNKSDTVQSMYMGPDGKLITGYRENLIAYSEAFGSWGLSECNLTPNQSDPFGGTGATIVEDDDSLGFEAQQIVTSTPGNTNGGDWTVSMYVKKEASSVANSLLRIWFGATTEYYEGLFNAYHGTSHMVNRGNSANATMSHQVIDAGGGWWRVVFTLQGVADTANAQVHFYPAVEAYNNGSFSGPPFDGTQQATLTCFGAQLENSAKLSTYTPTNGASVSFQVPRVEYDSAGNPLGLLVEEERTNLIPFSDFTNAAWTPGTAYTVSSASDSPSGGGAAQIDVAATGDAWLYDDVSATGLVGATMTYSLFAKSTNSTLTLKLQMIGATSTPAAQLQVNPSTGGSLLDTSTNITLSDYGATAIGNGWHRYWMSFVVPANTATLRPNIVAAVGTTYAYGPQLEQGAGPTSYIPTTGASATRAADEITLATSDFGYNTAAGTTAVDFTMQTSTASASYPRVYEVSSNTQNRDNIYYAGPTNSLHAEVKESGSSTTWDLIGSGVTFPLSTTAVVRHDGSNAVAALDGTLGATQSITTAPSTTRTRIAFGYKADGTPGNFMTGYIRRLTYWPRAISDDQLAEYSYDPNFGGRMEYRGILSLNEIAQSRR